MPAASPSRVVLITGAAGGLGQGLAREFTARGWHVAAGAHHPPAEPGSEQLWPLALDVTDPAQAEAVVGQIVERWQRLDVLVNNAGVAADQPLWLMDEGSWDRVMAVNLTGACNCSRAALGPMARQRDGHIINLSSFSARTGTRGQANYAAAKAGLIGFTASLAREMGAGNIRVNAVLPGILPTGMTAKLGEARLAALAAANALGRINSIAEVARFIVFLASMQNVSGQVFQLDSRIARWT
jgi:3-oxoacyl-[acyl-carrier protein] reductase